MYSCYCLILTYCSIALFPASLAESTCEPLDLRVSLSLGCVEGQEKVTVFGRRYYSFLGLPYAAPPVGELRFKAPRPPMPWSGVLNATIEPPACLQPWRENPFPIYFSEDCLYLNVFTPYLKPPSGKPLPVIVFIYGGKFFQGSASIHKYGPDFLLTKDVILVYVNYRLGIFGFLNMNISEAQGNASLKDKVAALRWVQREIAQFGGDPSRVTLMGDSSGASEVSLLYISPMTRGLFHAAISESGAALCYIAFTPSTASVAQRVAASLGCPTHDPEATVSCLRDVNGSVLAEQQMIVKGVNEVTMPFLPSIESDLGEEVFLGDTPHNLISKSGGVPYLSGFNNGEGLMFIKNLKENDLPKMRAVISSYLPGYMVKNPSQAVVQEITTRVNDYYFPENKTGLYNTLNGYVDLMTDRHFGYCILKTVEAIKARSPVYLYYFAFLGAFQPVHTFYRTLNLTGVCHGDELGYIFYKNVTITAHRNMSAFPKDMKVTENVINLWTNFATYGNPTPDKTDVKWDPASSQVNDHLIIGETLEMAHYSLISEREELWDTLHQLLFNRSTPRQTTKGSVLVYAVITLLVTFSVIVAITYYIQFRREINTYLEL